MVVTPIASLLIFLASIPTPNHVQTESKTTPTNNLRIGLIERNLISILILIKQKRRS